MSRRKASRPYVLSVAIQKGGTGKTTLAWGIADCLEAQGLRVLRIDLDSQASLSSIMGAGHPQRTAYDMIMGKASAADCITETPCGDVIAASPLLSSIDGQLSTRRNRATLLSSALEDLDGLPYDVVVVDTPPGLGLLLYNSLTAADGLLIPVSADPVCYAALDVFLDTVEQAEDLCGHRIPLLGMVIMRGGSTNLDKAYTELLQERGEVLGRVRASVAIQEAQCVQGRPTDPACSKCNAARDMMKITKQIVEKIKRR